MPDLTLDLEEPAWPDLHPDRFPPEKVIMLDTFRITALPHGMVSGATSVTLRLDLPDGRVVLAQTSLALFLAAAHGIAARYPSPPGTGENAP